MFDGKINAGEDCNWRVDEKSWGELVAEDENGAQRRDNWLNVQDDVDHSRVGVFKGESEKDSADCRAGEPGENQKAPSADVDPTQFAEPREKDRQKHEQDENVFPEYDDFSVEKFVKRNPPRAFGAPERRAQSDEPRPVITAVRATIFHAKVYRASDASRQKACKNARDSGSLCETLSERMNL